MNDASLPDPVALLQRLIAEPSVTPARGGVFDVLEAAVAPLGFTVERFTVAGVENLLALRAGAGPLFAFAGHLDVVPPGEGWAASPWSGEVRDGMVCGRGAADMKGAVAAFVAAAAAVPETACCLVITGDEEGPALHGTRALIEHMRERGIAPALCLVGEPTSVARLGDTIKVGRRGSVYLTIEVPGRQGHVAYPHLADNPIPKLVRALAAIDAIVLDGGTEWFEPSNIEITDLEVGNPTTNVIPARARARVSVRFNDLHGGEALIARLSAVVRAAAPDAVIEGRVSGEAFLTEPGALSELVSAAVREVTGLTPEMSTSGGTSDARFLVALCPVVELGLVNATMHMVDEAVAVADLLALTEVYTAVLRRSMAR